MDELLAPPDVESVVIDFLQARLIALGDTATVSDKTEEGRHVRILSTGGLARAARVLTQPQITADSYDTTEKLAWELAAKVSALMFTLEGTVTGGVVFAGISHFGEAVNLPDPLDQRPRYSETFVPRARVVTL